MSALGKLASIEVRPKADACSVSDLFCPGLVRVFVATLDSFVGLHCLDTLARLHPLNVRIHSLGALRLASLHAIAGLNALNILVGFIALDGLARLDPLGACAGLHFLRSLRAFAGLSRLDALTNLGSLRRAATLDALNSLRVHIAELPLEVRVLERHSGTMRGVEFPILELPASSDVHPVEPAVKNGIGLMAL